jgi:predicted RNA-binding protein
MSTQTDPVEFYETLEDAGEDTVRANLAKNVYAKKSELVHVWLRSKEDERSSADEERREAREEETLSLARSAKDAADEANRIASKAFRSNVRSERAARVAAIAAIVAAIAAISEYINSAPPQ